MSDTSTACCSLIWPAGSRIVGCSELCGRYNCVKYRCGSISCRLHVLVKLNRIAAAKRAVTGRQDKIAAVYDYLSGPGFKSRVVAIFECFMTMREELENQKKALQRIWASEKQIERVRFNAVGRADQPPKSMAAGPVGLRKPSPSG